VRVLHLGGCSRLTGLLQLTAAQDAAQYLGQQSEGGVAMDDGLHPLPAEFDRLQAPSSAYAPRQVVTYLCTREHVMSVPFAADAEVPEVWECRCGQPATRVAAADAS
jgi:hypothetical protein